MKNEFHPAQEFPMPHGGRLFIAPTHIHDIVIVQGSVLGGRNMLPKTLDLVPALTADLLDAGTAKKKKNVIRDTLAGKGMSLSFSSSGDRTEFSGQCFPEDLPMLLSTITECLGGAIFPEAEVKNAKALTLGNLAESKSNTRTRAEYALSALLYDPEHVNYTPPIETREKNVASIRRAHLQDFRKKLGKGGLVLAIVGDITTTTARSAAQKAFGKLAVGTTSAPVKQANKKIQKENEKLIPIADKANIDILLGTALPLTIQHPLYQPMKVLVEMLGGGVTSHLMQTIRERDGLTYGVYSSLRGLDAGADGYLKIWATFSPDTYKNSVEKLRQEIDIFFSKGLTEEALTKRKEEMTGSYLVALSTTHALAHSLHAIGANGFELSYLTEYPNIIRAVSLSDIINAAELIPRDKLSLAASGTFKKK
ncbi:MAG: pitrilysin family protein [bacterium]|nr:pitrilysin family protein [bacterium]MDO8742433.1 pitrilysin family protein [bacterium]